MHRSFSRCLAASALLAFALPACGGSHATPDMSPALKSQAQTQSLPGTPVVKNPTHSGLVNPTPGIGTKLLNGVAQYKRAADLARKKGTLDVGPFVGGAQGASVHHVVTKTPGPGVASLASLGAGWTPGTSSTLVLYDTTGQWGYLGELYAMASANLGGHFGRVDTEPISSYVHGQINQYTAIIYIGSTYYDQTNDGIPSWFYSDVAASNTPVIWIGDNIWNMADSIGTAAFDQKYGWDPTSSYFTNGQGNVGTVTQVTYKSEPLTRTIPQADDSGVLHPNILGAGFPSVKTLATAVDTSTSPATQFPWAIRSGNITYIGEIPYDFVTQSDRIIALEDLFFDALAPGTTTRHRAMMRLEDLSAFDNQTQLKSVAQYLYNNHIPYGFNVIPHYKDPLGAYNNGVPVDIALNSAAAAPFVATIKYMTSHGGTIIDEGWTHQYSNVPNPYTGASGDDAEFFLAHVDGSNNVIWDGPVPGDSYTWALGRMDNSILEYKAANIPFPSVYVTPHYFATDVDYAATAQDYAARYESSIYYKGTLSGQQINYAQYIGEFFPYTVQDVYGTTVLSENLGDYEPTSENNHPVRLAADLINEAKLNLAVRDGYASFFYDPSYGTTPLGQIIAGIKAAGYTFVATGK